MSIIGAAASNPPTSTIGANGSQGLPPPRNGSWTATSTTPSTSGYPRRTCLRRVLLRSFKDYGRNRSDLAEGCLEQFDVEFYRFVWDFPAKYRPYIVDGIERFGGHLRVSQFRHDRDADVFLATLGAP